MENGSLPGQKSRWQDVVKSLLALSVQDLTLEERLTRSVDIILNVSWLPLERQGGLFLFDKESESLRLIVSTGLAAPVRETCATVKLGFCLCGKAAQTGCSIHASEVDEEHDLRYPGMAPHGHYVVPIKHGEALLGVITLYLQHGHQRNEEELEALEIFCQIIATMIIRAEFEEELERARSEAERAALAKSRFLADMSHEIRTPLTAIVGYSEALQEDSSPAEAAQCITAVQRCAGHLLETVNSVLDHSKIESGKLEMDYQRVDFHALAADLIRTYERPARQKGLTLLAEIDPAIPQEIVTDPFRCRQILTNLISNAVKFTSTGSVAVSAGFDNDSDQILIAVKDTGIGMTPEESGGLFRPFSQAGASTTRRFGGTGLGLHIAGELAAKLGGPITIESKKGTGSTFSFALSCNSEMTAGFMRGAEHPEAAAGADNFSNLSGRLLIAEDNAEIRSLIKFLLRKSRLKLDFAGDGAEAVKMAAADFYDVILMDIHMPNVDGRDAVQQLRSEGCATPIVALTANVYQHDVENYYRLGFDSVLAKPFKSGKLCELLSLYCTSEPPSPSDKSEEELTLDDVVNGFVASLPKRLSIIRQCRDCQGFTGLRNEVHNLCAAGLFGFDDLEDTARQLQSKIDSGGDFVELADALEKILEDIFEARSK